MIKVVRTLYWAKSWRRTSFFLLSAAMALAILCPSKAVSQGDFGCTLLFPYVTRPFRGPTRGGMDLWSSMRGQVSRSAGLCLSKKTAISAFWSSGCHGEVYG